MPVWAVISLVAGVVLLMAALGAGGVFAYRAYRRRVLLRLVVQAEAIEAAAQALMDTITRLADASDEDYETFATEPDSSERRALHEITVRAGIIADELDRMPLLASLQPPAAALADAAFLIASEAGRVEDSHTGPEAIEHLAAVDLKVIGGYTSKARAILSTTCDVCGLEETAVYGGGLYL